MKKRADYITRAEFEEFKRELVQHDRYEELSREHETLKHHFNVTQEVFGRVMQELRGATFDAGKPLTGIVKWAQAATESGSIEMTVWFEPDQHTETEGRDENEHTD